MKHLGETQRAVLAVLRDGRARTTQELIEQIWGGDPEGGPDNAPEALCDALRRLRKRGVPVERVRLQCYRLKTEVAA